MPERLQHPMRDLRRNTVRLRRLLGLALEGCCPAPCPLCGLCETVCPCTSNAR